MQIIEVATNQATELVDITNKVERAVADSGISEGICVVFVPHTTAGITINENADPDVQIDILKEINKVIPLQDQYRHMEGNSAAHLKASLMGFSQTLIVSGKRLALGTWQGIYLCEFDGPRNRKVYVKVL